MLAFDRITYNGKDVEEAQACIDFLSKEFNVRLDAHLSELDQANCLAYRIMAEEYFVSSACDAALQSQLTFSVTHSISR